MTKSMKQAQNARKQRGRTSSRQNGKSGNQGNRSEQKIRGNPKQLVEKYKNQAREALQSGDRTQAEYYLQFADHYHRVLNEMRGSSNQAEGDGGQNNRRRRRGRGHQDENAQSNGAAESPAVETTSTPDTSATEQPSESKQQAADPSSSEQPVEVHPELDLGEEKPKPARRRRAPRKKPVETDAAAAAPVSEEGSLESDVA